MDGSLPDIFSKPGTFLPSIIDPQEKGEFDVKKLDENVKAQAEKLQK